MTQDEQLKKAMEQEIEEKIEIMENTSDPVDHTLWKSDIIIIVILAITSMIGIIWGITFTV